MNIIKTILIGLILLTTVLVYYLFRPLSEVPVPADFSCLEISEGSFVSKDSLPSPNIIYGMGLTYAKHLEETASEYNPDEIPPIFTKKLHSLTTDEMKVSLPSQEELMGAAGELEEGVVAKLTSDFDEISPMLDYEVELGIVLLEDIKMDELSGDDYIPQLGFFIANDLSARAIAVLGEGTSQRYEFWGISKSFPGFMPMSDQIWIPNTPTTNSIPCIKIETLVNGEVRQSQSTSDMMYTPLQMLRFIHQKYPEASLRKGDMILTGTPGGVAFATPRFLVRMANLLGFDRYKKLSTKLSGDLSALLKAGDVVEVRGDGLGKVTNEIVGG
ncbi:MAG: fumarylacetoacetate hydrolase family protein [Bacteroidota bacterium]